MKQKDVALIIIIATISGFASFFLSRFLFASPNNRQQKSAVVDIITTEFAQPNQKYFNINSIDPAQVIQVGDNNNPNPFNGAGQ
jgi:hypothetical protein